MYCKVCNKEINIDPGYCRICGTKIDDENLIYGDKFKNKFIKLQEYCAMGKYKKADKLITKLLKKDRKNIIYIFWKGYVDYQLRNLDDALKYYDKALELDSDFLPARIWRAILTCQYKGNDSEEFFRKLVKENPGNVVYEEFLETVEGAFIFLDENGRSIIDKDFNKESLEPIEREVDYESKLKESSEKLEENPQDIELLIERLDILLQLDKFDEILETTNLILSIDGNNKYGIYYKIIALSNLEEYDKLLEYYETIDISDYIDEWKMNIYYHIGHAYLQKGMDDKVAEYFLKSSKLAKNPDDEMFELLEVIHQNRDYPGILNTFDEILKLEKDNIPTIIFKGGSYPIEDYGLAEDYYKLALEYDPESIDALESLEDLYNTLGFEDKAEEVYNRLVEVDKEHVMKREKAFSLLSNIVHNLKLIHDKRNDGE